MNHKTRRVRCGRCRAERLRAWAELTNWEDSMMSKALPWLWAALGGVLLAYPAMGQAKHYGPGVTDTEITIGQTMPYSGPASSYGTIGKADEAYIAMVNDHGGVNGRKIKLISLDDGYSPPKTVEQMRKLVEEDHVL